MSAVLTVSGYHPLELNLYKPTDRRIIFLKKTIEKRLRSLIEEGFQWILISGQIGVELWAGEITLQLKNEYDVKLSVCPPFQNQHERWPEYYQHLFERIMLEADFFQCIYEDSYKGPYQFRAKNQFLVEKSDACLILMDEEHPGSTKYLYDVAQKRKNYPIYLITPFDVEEIVQEIRLTNPKFINGDV